VDKSAENEKTVKGLALPEISLREFELPKEHANLALWGNRDGPILTVGELRTLQMKRKK
jgi:hypothetical protein